MGLAKLIDNTTRKRTTVRKLDTMAAFQPDGFAFQGENLRSLELAIRSVLRMRNECRFKYYFPPVFPYGTWVYVAYRDGGVCILHGMMHAQETVVHTLTPRSVKRHLRLFRQMRHGLRYEDGNLFVNGKSVSPARWPHVFRTDTFRRMIGEGQFAGSPLAKAYKLWQDKPRRDEYESDTGFRLPGEHYDEFVARIR